MTSRTAWASYLGAGEKVQSVRSCGSSRQLEFQSLHPQGASQPTVALVSDDLTQSSGFLGHQAPISAQTHMHVKYPYTLKNCAELIPLPDLMSLYTGVVKCSGSISRSPQLAQIQCANGQSSAQPDSANYKSQRAVRDARGRADAWGRGIRGRGRAAGCWPSGRGS